MIRSIGRSIPAFILISLLIFTSSIAQKGFYEPIDYAKVKFESSDFGSMWTFDDVPLDRFDSLYNFHPDEEWFERAQKAALRFGGGCSAAFVSADGLIMTNHHCVRGRLGSIQREGENLLRDGFYADSLSKERKIDGLFVDQLLFIEDVTEDINSAIESGETDSAKIANRNNKISELEKFYSDETGLRCRIITLYNGGKYSLYGYKRYSDIRLVMAPDFQIAATGWDWDNFTYPRYELDFAFCRAYDDNGDPVESDFYFGWSDSGAVENEPIFVVGNPGNTDRLLPYSYLEFLRDVRSPGLLSLFNELYRVYYDLFTHHPERETELLNSVMGWGNARKSYAGGLMALNDKYIMTKKRDFERQLIQAVNDDPELKEKYGNLWTRINKTVGEISKYTGESIAFMNAPRFMPVYFETAGKVIEFAEQMKLPESERLLDYKDENIEETIDEIYTADQDVEFNKLMLTAHTNFVIKVAGEDNPIVQKIYGGNAGADAVNYVLSKSKMFTEEDVMDFIDQDPDDILMSDDPFICFIRETNKRNNELENELRVNNEQFDVLSREIGKAVFAVFGGKLPPDATGTLRISDGVIQGYEYNGTIAPGKTTFYGIWDRYFSFGGATYPWGLHPRWKTPPPELDLSIPCGFASTNDIVGGNSGSSVINKDLEVVGLVHDGNLESLAGAYIYLPENNRAVATDSWGLIEALKYIYHSYPLVEELKSGEHQ